METYFLDLSVFILAVSIAIISFKSLFSFSNCCLSIISLSISNSNQYAVSSASFNAIDSLFMKSALLCALWLSLTLATYL
jgi:hypothetical protein